MAPAAPVVASTPHAHPPRPGERGHAISKLVELPAAPVVGALVQADRERRVADVELDAATGEAVVYLVEDADDLAVQIDAAAHLARLDAMKAAGWEIEDEETLRVWLQERLGHRTGSKLAS